MNKLFMKLISTLFISNYLVFIILNLNMLICGYSLYEYFRYIFKNTTKNITVNNNSICSI